MQYGHIRYYKQNAHPHNEISCLLLRDIVIVMSVCKFLVSFVLQNATGKTYDHSQAKNKPSEHTLGDRKPLSTHINNTP